MTKGLLPQSCVFGSPAQLELCTLQCVPGCQSLPFLLFSALSRDHPLGEQQAAKVTASQTPMHVTKGIIEAGESRLDLTRLP